MCQPVVLTVNCGSSSLKASLFTAGQRHDFAWSGIGASTGPPDHGAALEELLQRLPEQPGIIGHRITHGGDVTEQARRIDGQELTRLEGLVELAPLHLPANLLGVRLCGERFVLPQVACYDTAFHATLPELARRLPLPDELGLRRHGFHGLSYRHVADTLPGLLPGADAMKVVVCHLGSGASLCLLDGLRSVDTSMGHTPAGGVIMATRPGDLDPGLFVELCRGMDAAALAGLIYHRSGLMALSGGRTGSMVELLDMDDDQARLAVAAFARSVRGEIGAMAARAGGIDALVFTGGIGEHSATVRAMIVHPLDFLGFTLDPVANASGEGAIGADGARPVLVIPADEEAVICRLSRALIR